MTRLHEPDDSDAGITLVIDAAVRDMVLHDVPPELQARIMERVEAATSESPSPTFGVRAPRLQPIVLAVALLCIAVGGVYYVSVPGPAGPAEPVQLAQAVVARPNPVPIENGDRVAQGQAQAAPVPLPDPAPVPLPDPAPENAEVSTEVDRDPRAGTTVPTTPSVASSPRVAVIMPRVEIPVVAGGLIDVAPLEFQAPQPPDSISVAEMMVPEMRVEPLRNQTLELTQLTVPAI